MKFILALLTVLLEARQVIGIPVVLGEPEIVSRQIGIPPPSASTCIFKFAPGLIIIPIGIPPTSANPLGFCSEFIQSSTTIVQTSAYTTIATVTRPTTIGLTKTSTRVITSVVTLTSLSTQTSTRTSTTSKPTTSSTTSITSKPTTPSTTSTSSAPTPTTTGALCPTPVADQTCGLAGWGYATNNIYSASGVDAQSCHQLCLQKSDCKSFQVVADPADPAPQCNLYNVPSGGSNTIPGASPYMFYDIGCPNYAPTNCKVKRDALAERVPTPWYFSGIAEETLSDICTCMVTKPLPTAVVTQTSPRVVTSTTAIFVPTTQTLAITTTSAKVSTAYVTRITTVTVG
ncbi:hypothetical protein HYALB_00010615 [Hymenoscyphus albidus]|uniref:Apple domain-containing protein n=1 Tax=Hymenoscyphus albidus TaxID=595503 RepID=A0A9N9LQB3_9HELO|nr:hypothetical protein HYALB_00010615 [Hymenoscyphus albidus]